MEDNKKPELIKVAGLWEYPLKSKNNFMCQECGRAHTYYYRGALKEDEQFKALQFYGNETIIMVLPNFDRRNNKAPAYILHVGRKLTDVVRSDPFQLPVKKCGYEESKPLESSNIHNFRDVHHLLNQEDPKK